MGCVMQSNKHIDPKAEYGPLPHQKGPDGITHQEASDRMAAHGLANLRAASRKAEATRKCAQR